VKIPTRDLTADDLELIAFARKIVDENTDGEDGIRSVAVTDLMPLAGRWSRETGAQPFAG
jgi:hypothetical protein